MNNTATQTSSVSPSYTGNHYLDAFLDAELDLLATAPIPELISVLDQGLRAILYTQLELVRTASFSPEQKEKAIQVIKDYLDERQDALGRG